MQANEIFHLLELSKLRVKFYEEKLKSIQNKILLRYKAKPVENREISKKAEKRKEKEIEAAMVEKVVKEVMVEKVDDFFDKKKKLWDD